MRAQRVSPDARPARFARCARTAFRSMRARRVSLDNDGPPW
jgi:hypothetical protein